MKKLVSILIAAYNAKDFIKQCLDSIPNNESLEIIVINDCSTDNTLSIIKNYPNIKIINNKINNGIGLVRQQLLDAATGEYIYFLDSDDWLNTAEFEKTLTLLKDCDILETKHIQNNGKIWTPKVFRGKFVKASMAKAIKFKNVRCQEDTYWRLDFADKYPNAIIKTTDVIAYHYNFPRDGSLTDLNKHKKQTKQYLYF